jgi:hypothetical protein
VDAPNGIFNEKEGHRLGFEGETDAVERGILAPFQGASLEAGVSRS